MSDATAITVDAIEALASKLDGLAGLDEADKATLATVFTLAGQAAAPTTRSLGFSLNFTMPGNVNAGGPNFVLPGAFKLGLSQGGFGQPGGSQMGGQPHMGERPNLRSTHVHRHGQRGHRPDPFRAQARPRAVAEEGARRWPHWSSATTSRRPSSTRYRDDLGAAGDDVEGFDKSSGKVHFNDFSITRKIDAASPMLLALYTPDPPGHGPGVEGAEDGGLL